MKITAKAKTPPTYYRDRKDNLIGNWAANMADYLQICAANLLYDNTNCWNLPGRRGDNELASSAGPIVGGRNMAGVCRLNTDSTMTDASATDSMG